MDDDVEDPDDIMCNFIPMVKEYLTCKFYIVIETNKPVLTSNQYKKRKRRKKKIMFMMSIIETIII